MFTFLPNPSFIILLSFHIEKLSIKVLEQDCDWIKSEGFC